MRIEGKNILISPLDWGLGHTTRCIPVIKALQDLRGNVFVAVNSEQRKMLEQEVQGVYFIYLKGYEVYYPKNSSLALSMMLQSPKILARIRKEHLEVERIVRKNKIDLVISDNRFGAYSTEVPSVYITHQINIQAPLGIDRLLYAIHKKYRDKYAQCWIPDEENFEQSLGGHLSHFNVGERDFHIGILSRFEQLILNSCSEYEYLAILSGPEPQRSVFEKEVVEFFLSQTGKCVIVGGKPKEGKAYQKGNIDYFSHLTTQDFSILFERVDKVICRPGYSSIMDLATLQKEVFFIPTRGQTEQEYLAHYHWKKNKIGYRRQGGEWTMSEMKFNKLPYLKTNLKERLEQLIRKL